MEENYSRRAFIRTGAILGAGFALSDVLARSATKLDSEGPILGEIRMVSFNFAPKGWALCNGQTLAINSNQALYALLGNVYGGNGTSTFNLPNLGGKVPIHVGDGYPPGVSSGSAAHTLLLTELPRHGHPASSEGQLSIAVGGEADSTDPGSNYLAANSDWVNRFYEKADDGMGPGQGLVTAAVGGSQAHLNLMPYLTLNFIIALEGDFPTFS